MHHRDSLFEWAIPCGTWFGVRARLSPLFLLVALVLCAQLALDGREIRISVLFTLGLLVAALCHELAHLLAARLAGGSTAELVFWPLGGMVRTTGSAAPIAVAAAGPLMNLVLAVVCLLVLAPTGVEKSVLNPLILPTVDLAENASEGLLSLFFYANWLLAVANLLPAAPMDAGRMLETMLTGRMGQSAGQQAMYRVGLGVGFATVIAGLILSSVWLCALGAGLVAYNLRESVRQQMAETFDESFMGYDFSQGYTSLERSVPAETDLKPGLLRRWMAYRRAVREERLRTKAVEAERELDFLLGKVHTYGIDSLTDSEKRILKRASARYRGRSKS